MKARMLFVNGTEEVEALTVVDILRRAGVECTLVSVFDAEYVTGSHNITIKMDEKISKIDGVQDMLILPGGIPGVPNLASNEKVRELVHAQNAAGKYVAAICAAPTIFGSLGILKDKVACCYPSMEEQLRCKEVSYEPVVHDGNIITSRGLGTAVPFALKLVELLVDKETADELGKKIVYNV